MAMLVAEGVVMGAGVVVLVGTDSGLVPVIGLDMVRKGLMMQSWKLEIVICD